MHEQFQSLCFSDSSTDSRFSYLCFELYHSKLFIKLTHKNENRKHVRNRTSRNLCQSLNFKPRPGRQKPNIYQLSEFNEASWTWTVVDTHHHGNKWPKEKGWTQEWECVHGEVSAPREEQPASRLANISPREAALNAPRAARRSSADMKTMRIFIMDLSVND